MGSRLYTLSSLCTVPIAIASLCIAGILVYPTLRGSELQGWTSRKDYFQYCKDELVRRASDAHIVASLILHKISLVGIDWDNCDRAIKDGLQPPPGFPNKSTTLIHKRSVKAIIRRTSTNLSPAAHTRSSTHIVDMDAVFERASRHIWLTWLFWFCVSIVLTIQARRGVKILSRAARITLCDRWQLLLSSTLSTCIITLSVVVIVSAQSRWVASKQQEAIYEYCHSALVNAPTRKIRIYR
jgi:hypothetical protein